MVKEPVTPGSKARSPLSSADASPISRTSSAASRGRSASRFRSASPVKSPSVERASPVKSPSVPVKSPSVERASPVKSPSVERAVSLESSIFTSRSLSVPALDRNVIVSRDSSASVIGGTGEVVLNASSSEESRSYTPVGSSFSGRSASSASSDRVPYSLIASSLQVNTW